MNKIFRIKLNKKIFNSFSSFQKENLEKKYILFKVKNVISNYERIFGRMCKCQRAKKKE